MKRTIRIKLQFEIVIDDDQEGLPYVRDPCDLIMNGIKSMKGLTEIKPGAKFDMVLDRESWNEIRRRDRVRRANSR